MTTTPVSAMTTKCPTTATDAKETGRSCARRRAAVQDRGGPAIPGRSPGRSALAADG